MAKAAQNPKPILTPGGNPGESREAFKKRLQDRQDKLDEKLPHRAGKTRLSKIPPPETEPKEE